MAELPVVDDEEDGIDIDDPELLAIRVAAGFAGCISSAYLTTLTTR